MKLPIQWLKDYIDPVHNAERLAEALTLSGTKVESLGVCAGSPVLTLEITTNRPDCLSLLGLAREVSALQGKPIRWPKAYTSKPMKPRKPSGSGSFAIRIEDRKACPFYSARLLRNVRVQEAPAKIRGFLESVGLRPISNAVDATNFVLFEIGQPLHVFDADKIAGGTIRVRRAKKGEKFLGLNDLEYTLDEKVLVIADGERPIAIAGVMGGKLTEVTAATKNILLESAYFDMRTVREASRALKLSTDSSYRFERGVCPGMVIPASQRAADLIREWGGGDAEALTAEGALPDSKNQEITLSLGRVNGLLGVEIPPARIQKILRRLGFITRPLGKDRLRVLVPKDRRDISGEADLAEEVIRIHGFETIPVTLPATRYTSSFARDKRAEKIQDLKKHLASLGFNETLTYSLLSRRALEDSGFGNLEGLEAVVNAQSAEQEFFRPSLLSGVLQTVLFNINRKALALRVFEIGNRILKGREETMLAIGIYGRIEENWKRKSESSLYDLKGVAANLLHVLRVQDVQWTCGASWGPLSQVWRLEVSGETVGCLGRASAETLRQWDIPREVPLLELNLDSILKHTLASNVRKAVPLPKFPSVRRDIAFVADETVPVHAFETVMMEAAQPFLRQIDLFDEFIGKSIPAGKRSLAFSLAYQKATGTFTDQEIQELQSKVAAALKGAHDVELRA